MDAFIKPIENALAPVFKELPPLPVNVKKALVRYWPIIALVLGVVQLIAAFGLWRLGHIATGAVNYVNQMSMAAGNGEVVSGLSIFFYLGIASLVADGALLLMAYAPLVAHRKKGWDLLFLASLVNVLYGVVLLFDGYYGGFMHLISSLIGSAIGWYFLFQVRDFYTGAATSQDTKSSSGKSEK